MQVAKDDDRENNVMDQKLASPHLLEILARRDRRLGAHQAGI